MALQKTKLFTDVNIADTLKLFVNEYEICVSKTTGLSDICFLFFRKQLDLTSVSIDIDLEGIISCERLRGAFKMLIH